MDLTDVSSTIQKEFSYELLDSQGNVVENDGVRVSHKRVAVTAPVYIIKELPLVVSFKQAAGSMEADTRWDLEYDTIQVAGEPASLESLNEITLGEVDLTAILSDRDDIQLNITMPAGCYTTTTRMSSSVTSSSWAAGPRRSTSTELVMRLKLWPSLRPMGVMLLTEKARVSRFRKRMVSLVLV